MRSSFLREHGMSILRAIAACGEAPSLSPTPLDPLVQARFLTSFRAPYALRPAFHGTHEAKHQSIFRRGLLVPGFEPDIKVENGSAHGNGIYTAKLNNPMLSVGFSRGCRKLLVCGVIDDATAVDEPMGRFSATAKSDRIYHVGDAMVVFDHAAVAPLFVADWH